MERRVRLTRVDCGALYFYRAAYMQGGLSYGKCVRLSVCLSVRPSVRHTREL